MENENVYSKFVDVLSMESYSTQNDYDELLIESFTDCVNESGRELVRKAVHAGKSIGKSVGHAVTNIDKTTEPVDNMVNNTIANIKKSFSDEKKEEILLGENKFKLTRVVTKCIAYGGLMLIHPALAAIAFLGKLARDRRVDIKERDKIVNEMNHELTLVREKIKDADSKGDNKEKYALMRIEHKLQTEISRIKFRTD